MKVDPNTDFSKALKLPWDVEIIGIPYQVILLRGQVHPDGHGGENELWCYPRDREPSPTCVVPYCMREFVQWDFEFHNHARLKIQYPDYSDPVVIDHPRTIIMRNGELFYTVYGEREESVARAMDIISAIKSHPFHFEEYDYVKRYILGQLVKYQGQQGVITGYDCGWAAVKPIGADYFISNSGIKIEEGAIDCLERSSAWDFTKMWRLSDSAYHLD